MGPSPLTYAAKELKKEAVELLITYGADINFVDEEGNTALIIASKEAFGIESFKLQNTAASCVTHLS